MNSDTTDARGLTHVSHAVLISGAAARILLDALSIAVRARRLSGLSTAPYRELAQALAEVASHDGHVDVPDHPVLRTPDMAQKLLQGHRWGLML